ncbi:hypothetical protein KL86PLE_40940 [uncultured Pleomorphomonas sp.]|uniref:Chemotaxis receptor methyltransferase CheR N-terminal domain-containing protein n=1 Tax=uncultured Pleomorphomonas sp. TaxID=442121 RepID=A0A212LHV1_9HYPH|nr:hypothetical protein [uncultured Pleomorphomonas sp.]SCM77134.1 hypothetical protein KL86PLE_40940 [uncultured Pleomorphomonas sp.]
MSSVQATQSDRSVDQLSAKNFRRLSAFVSSYSGIKMPPGKQTMLEGRLRRRLRATGFQSLDAYCTYLFEKGGIETRSSRSGTPRCPARRSPRPSPPCRPSPRRSASSRRSPARPTFWR